MSIEDIAEFLNDDENERMRAWASRLTVDNPEFSEDDLTKISLGEWP